MYNELLVQNFFQKSTLVIKEAFIGWQKKLKQMGEWGYNLGYYSVMCVMNDLVFALLLHFLRYL